MSRNDELRAIIGFITRYDPAYPDTLRGASPEQIARLTELLGRELPPAYLSFLELMGNSMGRLNVQHSDFTIANAIRFHDDRFWRPPENYVYLAEDGSPENRDYFLDEAHEGGTPAVVRFSSYGEFKPEDVELCYASLGDMLLSHAFVGIRMPLLAQGRRYNTSGKHPQPLRRLHEIALKLGFQEVMNTCPWSTRYDQADAAIRGYHHPAHANAYVQLAARDESELRRMESILDDHIGLGVSLGPP